MLVRLTIRNYALIHHLEMEPSARLNVITGETGAGKSIMLGAVGLLLGNRADTKVLWNESEKCVIEGTFDIGAYKLEKFFETENLDYEEQTVIRREISPAGKSRAFINDTPVTLDTLRMIGGRLMDVHSQHETLELASRSFQLNLVDTYAGNAKIREAYLVAWKKYSLSKKNLDALIAESTTLRQEDDFVKFQLKELTSADLTENEQEKLESDFRIMEHAEDIKVKLNESLGLLNADESSVRSLLADVRTRISSLSSYGATYEQLYDRIESMRIELDDIISELDHEEGRIDFDASKTEKIKNRLSLIYQLLQKHRSPDVRGLLALQEQLQLKSEKTTNLDASLAAAKAAVVQDEVEIQKKSKELSSSRQKVTKHLCKQLTDLLQDLGIPDARLQIEMESISPGPDGADSIEILFSANKGIDPRPLGQVASGGEFSRVMFSVKYVMAEKTALPTLILDEIDNGISGEVAIQLGKMMKDMARNHQLITITHLPQIAAKGDSHYFVFKDAAAGKTTSNIQQLEGESRISEIAKMIGGAKPSATAVGSAKEMMQ